MSILVAEDVEKAWADRLVLRGCDLSVDRGEIVGLVGPNGCGKSTLLRLMGGLGEPDAGRIEVRGRLALLDQDPRLEGATVAEAAARALDWHAELLAAYERAIADGQMDEAATLQDRLDHVGWTHDHRVDAMLDRVDAPPADAPIAQLSGGEKRRVALARTLLSQPDVLLLDEPTNHLDHTTVDWLQGWLEAFDGAVVLVTHDRYLLDAITTRIVEIDDGVCVSYDGSYGDYLIGRAERQAQLQRSEDSRLSLIAREAEWAARSPSARSTKQKARLERLDALRSQRKLPTTRDLHLDFRTGLKQGQVVLEAKGLSSASDARPLFRDLDLDLLRGERLGIVGPNGAGKSTLLHVIAGTYPPDAGTFRLSPRVKLAVLDQHRSGLDPTDTVFEAAGGGADRVTIGDHTVHVAGLLDRFLFPGSMHRAKVATLSGGERARLLLARMLLQGANLLLLDEPTNDLDLMTLRVLEEALLGFDGAALIVTHDRAFLDRVCTAVLAFEPDGVVTRYADRTQALRAARDRQDAVARVRKVEEAPAKPEPTPSSRKLTGSERRELKELPQRIAELEAAVEALEARLGEPEVWQDGSADELTATLKATEASVAEAWARWEALDERA